MMERTISNVLRGGVLASALLIAAGIVMALAGIGGIQPPGPTGPPLAVPLTQASDILAGLASLDGRAYVALGLLVLIGTPVMRVAAALVAFAMARDWRFVAIAGSVLAVLILAFIVGS